MAKGRQAAHAPFEPKRADYWQARAALAGVILLQIALAEPMQAGSGVVASWVVPGGEAALLILLTLYKGVEHAAARRQPSPAERYLERHGRVRVFAIAMIAAVTAANIASLARLLNALLHASRATGAVLLDDAANLWATNIVCFALCYWEVDRGGPAVRGTPKELPPDFLFANQTAPDASAAWRPGFVDYLFVAFTNATAFSPTDALPLSPRVKLIMMAQSLSSLTTIALVAARAVNILG